MVFDIDSFKAAIRRHAGLIFLSLIVSIIYGGHSFLVSRTLTAQGLAYQPVTIAVNRDEGAFYGPRVKAVYDGQWLAGDIEIAGNERSASALPILNPILLAVLGRISGSLENGFIVSEFLLPALIFAALYFLALELFSGRLLALTFAIIFIFVPKIFLAVPPVSNSLLKSFWSALGPDINNGLYFSRFEYPRITFLFYALALLFMLKAFRSERRHFAVLAGISLGLTFYTYLYDWVYVFIGLGIMSGIFLWRREFQLVRRLMLVALLALIVALPYFVNAFNLNSLPHHGDLMARLGFEVGHNFRWGTAWKSYARATALILLVWLGWAKRSAISAVYLISFLAPIMVVLNLQVIFGFNPQPDHWHRVQFLPAALSIWAVGVWFFQKYAAGITKQLWQQLGVVSIFIMCVSQFYGQIKFSRIHAGNYAIPTDYLESYQWLDQHAPQGSAVAVFLSRAASELPLYASAKLLVPNGFNTTISTEEIWDRFMTAAMIFGVSVQEFESLAKDPEMLLYLFHDAYRDPSFDSYFKGGERSVPPELLQAKLARYHEFLKIPTDAVLKKYRLDYLYLDKADKQRQPAVKIKPLLQKVYENSAAVIYQI